MIGAMRQSTNLIAASVFASAVIILGGLAQTHTAQSQAQRACVASADEPVRLGEQATFVERLGPFD